MEDKVEELTTPSKRTRDKLLKIGEKIEHQGRKASSAKRKGSNWRIRAGAPGNKRCESPDQTGERGMTTPGEQMWREEKDLKWLPPSPDVKSWFIEKDPDAYMDVNLS